MIISRGRKFVLVHAPKTGGTALSLALESRAMADDILIGDTPKAKRRRARLEKLNARGRLWKHATLADIDGVISPAELNEFYVLMLVRNPWDRMVSYYHWLKDQNFDHVAVKTAKAMEFNDFLAEPAIRQSIRSHPYPSYVAADDGKEYCSKFVRLEFLESDLSEFWDHVGFRLPIEKTNASERDADYRTYYDAVGRNTVAQDCATDIARFGYEFD